MMVLREELKDYTNQSFAERVSIVPLPLKWSNGNSNLNSPRGYFCPSGSFEPRACDFVSYCPAGTISQTSFVGVTIVLVLDFLLVVLISIRFYYERKRLIIAGSLPPGTRLGSTLTRIKATVAVVLPKSDMMTKQIVPLQEIEKEEQGISDDVKQRLSNNFKRAMEGETLNMGFIVEELGYRLPTGKHILQGVNAVIKPGRMTAIMGPSGAGSTLNLN